MVEVKGKKYVVKYIFVLVGGCVIVFNIFGKEYVIILDEVMIYFLLGILGIVVCFLIEIRMCLVVYFLFFILIVCVLIICI